MGDFLAGATVAGLIGLGIVCAMIQTPEAPKDGRAYRFVPAQKAKWVPVSDAQTTGTEPGND